MNYFQKNNFLMKIFISLLLFPLICCAQKREVTDKSSIELDFIKLLSATTEVVELVVLQDMKTYFPASFKSFPDLNPINPSNDHKISSRFSSKRLHPIYGKVKAHNGIDIVAKLNTPVYATADGTIEKSQFFNGAAGHSVSINHKFGFVTRYFHLNIFIVENGEKVKKGQIIGFLGSTGSSTAPHLHYEIWKNKKVIDPKYFLNSK